MCVKPIVYGVMIGLRRLPSPSKSAIVFRDIKALVKIMLGDPLCPASMSAHKLPSDPV